MRRHATIASVVIVENALSPAIHTAALRAAAAASLLLAVAGCGVFKGNEEAQAVVNQRLVGTQVGEFFERYGRPRLREPQADGSADYSWISGTAATQYSGYYGIDDRTCTMRIAAAKDGRIVSAAIIQDMPGRTSTSRCLELFKAP